MLSIVFLVALIGAIEFTVTRIRRRIAARRYRVPEDDLVIDLTYMHEAIRRDQELAARLRAERIRAEREVSERRSTSPGGGGR